MADNRQFADHVEIGGANVYFKEEPTTDTTMANTSYFKTVDADGNPVKISRDNIMGIVKECLGTILNGLSDQTTVTKVPTLNGNTLGASTAATLASLLGVGFKGTINSSSGQSYDMDSLADGSYIYFDEGNLISHNPLGQSSFGVIINKKLGSSKIQFVYLVSYSNPKKYYITLRVYNIEFSGWNGWCKIELT